MALDVNAIRQEFPILSQRIDGHPLIYLDNAATAQKPRAVLEALRRFYEESNANVHRGMHVLAERATVAFESARAAVQQFIGAQRPEEIIFTKSCTEAINLVAKSWGRAELGRGDAVVLSVLEHHSNVVPWLQLKEEKGIELRWIDIDDRGNVKLVELDQFLAQGNVKLVAITTQSNVLGVRPPLREIITKAHAANAFVLVDAAQSIAHHATNVQDLDCDFLAFSGHKLYGPTGIGILHGKRALLEVMPAFLGGGMMIQEVHTDHFTPAELPQKFEGGTQPIAQAIGLHAAIDWLGRFQWEDIEAHEHSLLALALEELATVPGLTILGPRRADEISGCISFLVEGIHSHDLTEVLGREGICLRAGHHCTQPLHRRLGLTASSRLSVALYNTHEEVRAMAQAIRDLEQHFKL
jgi:cysteine desulfurase/selenocysteine lyase